MHLFIRGAGFLIIAQALIGTTPAGTNVYFWGDSLTWGIDGNSAQTRVTNPWPALLCNTTGWVCANYGIPGATSRDLTYPNMTGTAGAASPGIYQHEVTNSDVNFLTVGTNDLRGYGQPEPPVLQSFQLTQLADAAFLAIPDSAKINPRSQSNVGFSGQWLPTSIYTNYGMNTNNQGATAVFSGTGGTLILAFTRFYSSSVSWQVSIDGQNLGTISGQEVQVPANQNTYSSDAFLFTGLGDTTHTVVLTLNTPTGDFGFWDWAAFVSGAPATDRSGLPHLYIGSVQKQAASAYASCIGGTLACTDASTAALNQVLKANAAALVANGLNVSYVDFFNYIDPGTDLGTDGEHETQAGYTKLAGYWETCIAANPPQMCMGDTITVSQTSPVTLYASAGSTIPIRYHWFGGPTESPQAVFVHIDDGNGNEVASGDFIPALPTTAWSGFVTLQEMTTIPAAIPPGTYYLDAGLFTGNSRMTLTPGSGVTAQGFETYRVGTLTIPDAANGITVIQASPSTLFGAPGDSIPISYNFFGGPTLNPQTVFVHIDSTTGATISYDDFSPHPPTTSWNGATALAGTLTIPSGMAPGTYYVDIGLYSGDSRVAMTPGSGVVNEGFWVYRVAMLTVAAGTSPMTVYQSSPSSFSVAPGGSVQISYNWFGGPTGTPQTVFVHIDDASGSEATGADFIPSLPTTSWNGAVSLSQTIAIPSAMASGTYGIDIGLYSGDSRVLMTAGPGVTDLGSDVYRVGTLTVTGP
jgi:hypothetical protein